MAGGRSRRLVRRRGTSARRRPDPARHPLSAWRSARISPASCSPTRTRIIIGALIDLWPKLKVPVYATPFTAALLEAKRRGEPGAPEIPVNIVAARQPLQGRAVRHRAGVDGAFDSRIQRAHHPHALRHRAAHRRLEDRSDADARRPPPTRRSCARSATKAASRWSAIPPMRCAKAARPRKPTSPRPSPN